MSAPRIPDFYIVGHGKSGTTAMYEMLRRHPQIFMPDFKEPGFFAQELFERTPPRPEGTPQTLEQYAALFERAEPDQLVGEATALYLWSRTAAAAIARERPDARIIAIFREPASFLHSLHLQFLQVHVETESDFARALEHEESRRDGRDISPYSYWPQLLLYSEHVRYVEQLRRYEDLFSPEQMKVFIYDDFRADNEATIREALGFLRVDVDAPVEAVRANPTVSPRSQRLNEMVHAVGVGRGPLSRGVKTAIKTLTPAGPRRAAFHGFKRRFVFGAPDALDESLARDLRARFRAEVEALSEHLGRDLVALWGYDRDG